jgi:hypothetical protein
MGVLGVLGVCGGIYAGVAFAEEEAHKGPVVVRTTQATFLSSEEFTPVTVASVTLAKGTWIVQADESVVGINQHFANVRCWLEYPGYPGGSSATSVGNAAGFPLVATDVFTAGVTLSATTTVKNVCSWENAGRKIAGSYYIDAGATLTATKAAKLAVVEVP